MRLCFVSQEYPPETARGGIGTQTYVKAHGLAALGHDVHVLSRSVDAERHDYIDGSVHVTRIPGIEPRMPPYTQEADWLTYSTEVAVTLSKLNEQNSFDVIDFPEFAGEGYIYLLNRTEWNYSRVVVQIHGSLDMFANTVGWPELDSEFYRVGTAMESTCLRLANQVYSSSACSADWCARKYGLIREMIPVIHTGVDTSLFRPVESNQNDLSLMFVGRVTRDKGVHILVDAACQIASEFPGLQVEICGRGEPHFIDALQSMANAASHPELLKFHDYVDRHELPRYLGRASVFVGPSKHEPGPGLVCLEAMACGVPVVACSGAGAAEVVLPERNGLLVPPDDVDALAVALRRLLSNPEERARMGKQGREYALLEADSRLCLARLEEFYKTVISTAGTVEAE